MSWSCFPHHVSQLDNELSQSNFIPPPSITNNPPLGTRKPSQVCQKKQLIKNREESETTMSKLLE